jgi:hypothetical protein
MVNRRPRRNTVRLKVWRSMRSLGRFTAPDLCRASGPGAKINNVRKFIRRLAVHGYVAKHGDYESGHAGVYQGWRLVRDTGPEYPTVCDRCGNVLDAPCTKEENS